MEGFKNSFDWCKITESTQKRKKRYKTADEKLNEKIKKKVKIKMLKIKDKNKILREKIFFMTEYLFF